MIQNLSLIFGSKTKAQEIVLLLKNVKEVVRQGFYDSELFQIEKFCQENNLYLVKSKFKVTLGDGGDEHSIYSNQGLRIPEQDSHPGMFFVYFSKDEEKAWLASYHELVHNQKDLGLLLGYPPCCVDFFCNNFSPKNSNLQLKPTNLFTNLTQREQDLVILSHFPCSSDCPESLIQGKKYLQAIKEMDKFRAEELVRELSLD
ncbi:MAG TPA: DUF483 domain-containing protein [Candidatus Nanoarchaeia archaeon]|nr:DUF483 domain-containing protein [Candidatus Nanoarchaeia archaeon]